MDKEPMENHITFRVGGNRKCMYNVHLLSSSCLRFSMYESFLCMHAGYHKCGYMEDASCIHRIEVQEVTLNFLIYRKLKECGRQGG